MSVTKHQLFKLLISNEKDTFTINNEQVEKFLADPNIVYLSHSISIVNEDIELYGRYKSVPVYILFSLVYKDLNATKFDLKKSNKKIRSSVHEQIISDNEIKEPDYKTEIDKIVSSPA